jgi:carbon monoxide dehydrogenase subunit G
MASIRTDIPIDADAETVWQAVRDVGAVHRRLAPGFVVDARREGDSRIVTFANGAVVRELIVDIDDAARRLAYAAVGGRAAHHHAVMQVLDDGTGRSRLVWITDVLPDDAAVPIRALVAQAAQVIRQTLARPAPAGSVPPAPAPGR